MLDEVMFESKYPRPATARVVNGEVVPIPKPVPVRRISSVSAVRLSERGPKAREPCVDEAYQCFKFVPALVSVRSICGRVEEAMWRTP